MTCKGCELIKECRESGAELQTCKRYKPKTNFDRITDSPEKLAEFIHEAESVYERCAKGDLNCDYCECQWCGLAGRKDLIDWLNKESKGSKNE